MAQVERERQRPTAEITLDSFALLLLGYPSATSRLSVILQQPRNQRAFNERIHIRALNHLH